jgi:hypothetical protein
MQPAAKPRCSRWRSPAATRLSCILSALPPAPRRPSFSTSTTTWAR